MKKVKTVKSEYKYATCPFCKDPVELYIDGVRSNFCPMCGKSFKGKKIKIEQIDKVVSTFFKSV